jgi:hypothetical protein
MIDEESFVHKTLELATEWSKLMLSDETLASQVPNEALIVFQLENDATYNAQSLALAKMSHAREPKRPIVFARVKGLAPPLTSRLLEPHLEVARTL